MAARKIVVIGGSAAGAKAAAKARRLDQQAEITIIQGGPHLSMASCGYPYYVGGVFQDRKMLLATPTGVVRDPAFFAKTKNIRALTLTEAVAIDRRAKEVACRDLGTGRQLTIPYDKLILCTGGSAIPLPAQGGELAGVTHLLSMADSDFLRAVRDEKRASRAVIIGGGLIGVETCEALRTSGLNVTLVEIEPRILAWLDPQLAGLVANHMRGRGVEIVTGKGIQDFLGEAGKLVAVRLQDGTFIDCEVAVVATGVRPNVQLARAAGLAIGELGGIAVDGGMATSDPDIFAAGDCVEVRHLLTGLKVLAPMGDLANLQGRVAGENAATGGKIVFPGTIQTMICKVFDFAAGAAGLTEEAAARYGFDSVAVVNASPDRPSFMGAGLLVSKIVAERSSGRILGYQCVGSGDVSRQMATAAMAIQGGMTLDRLTGLDLPYAPPFSLAIDHFIASAHILENKVKGRFKTVTAAEVKARIGREPRPFLLDGRGPDEYEALRLGIGEHYIPLGALRERLGELPADKDAEIICFCKISLRGYEAALVLEAHGWTNVRVMEGGILAWPYEREK